MARILAHKAAAWEESLPWDAEAQSSQAERNERELFPQEVVSHGHDREVDLRVAEYKL